jgi:hypothetical protein
MLEHILNVSDRDLSDSDRLEDIFDLPTAEEIQAELEVNRERKFRL